jgi:hypothetical protein
MPYAYQGSRRPRPSEYSEAHGQPWLALESQWQRLDDFSRSFQAWRDEVIKLQGSVGGLSTELHTSNAACEGQLKTFHAELNGERRAREQAVSTALEKAETYKADIEKQVAEARKPNYPLWGLVIAIVFGIVPLVNAITGNAIESHVTPIASRVVTAETIVSNVSRDIAELRDRTVSSLRADETSRRDREQLNDRVKMIETSGATLLAANREWQGRTQANLAEIETQFKNQTILDAIMYEKLFGARFPSDVTRQLPVQ